MAYTYLFKFIIVGETGVGKSCLLLQFSEGKFHQNLEMTIGVEFGSKYISIDEVPIKLQIWDTAGQESFRAITRSYYRGTAGALLVFDITRRETFNRLGGWINECRTNSGDRVNIILVGNKTDEEPKRAVTMQEASDFARENGLMYIETSAKANKNVEEAFLECSRAIYNKILTKQIDLTQPNCGIVKGNSQGNSKTHNNSNKNYLLSEADDHEVIDDTCCGK